MGDAAQIEQVFNARFEHWDIRLPERGDRPARGGGHLFRGGWHVGFLWGIEGGEEYLEVYEQHRMTSDGHWRIFSSGRVEELEAADEFFSLSEDAPPEEREQAERRYLEHPRRVYGELRERGLLPPHGHNLPAHEINEYLRSGGGEEA